MHAFLARRSVYRGVYLKLLFRDDNSDLKRSQNNVNQNNRGPVNPILRQKAMKQAQYLLLRPRFKLSRPTQQTPSLSHHFLTIPSCTSSPLFTSHSQRSSTTIGSNRKMPENTN